VGGNQRKNDALIAKNLLEGKTCEFCAYKKEEFHEKKDTKHLCFYGIDKIRSVVRGTPNTPKENTCEHWKKFDLQEATIKAATKWSEGAMKDLQAAMNKDAQAMMDDWKKIGEDFKTVLGDFTKWSSKE
jgi:hypothetical protein